MDKDDQAVARDTLVEPSLPPPLSPDQTREVLLRLLELEKICQQARRQLLDELPNHRSAQQLFEKLIVATYAVRDELREAVRQDEGPDVFLEAFIRESDLPPESPITSFPKAMPVLEAPVSPEAEEPPYRDARYPELHQEYTPLPAPLMAYTDYPTPLSGHGHMRPQQVSTWPAPPPSFEGASAPPAPPPQSSASTSLLAAILGAILFFFMGGPRR